MTPPTMRTVFAPAKINLSLHVTGKREDGYHTLDSLIAFADIGDILTIEPSERFEFSMDGPFARAFAGRETDASPQSSNLAVQAAWECAKLAKKNLNVKLNLTKNLPLGAGLGGGSSDAAAVVWGLLETWKFPAQPTSLQKMLLILGADVPVCYACTASHVSGIGEKIQPLKECPEIPIVLVYPGKPCTTGEVFRKISGSYRPCYEGPEKFTNPESLLTFLYKTENDLQKAACEIVPAIENVLHTLRIQNGCLLARMSGSGSACFGLFESFERAEHAAAETCRTNPDWWVRTGWLGRPERY